MKNLILPLSLAICGLIAVAGDASAQRYDPRIDVPRVVAPPGGPGFHDDLRGRDTQLAYELDRLDGEVKQVRREVDGSRDRRLRSRFDRVRATDQLNYDFYRGGGRREIRARIGQVRTELYRIQEELRKRPGKRR